MTAKHSISTAEVLRQVTSETDPIEQPIPRRTEMCECIILFIGNSSERNIYGQRPKRKNSRDII